VLADADLRDLLATCAGTDFTARRDAAIILLFLDGGLRLSELAGLQVADVDLRDRIVFPDTNPSGPARTVRLVQARCRVPSSGGEVSIRVPDQSAW
jgi:integrase